MVGKLVNLFPFYGLGEKVRTCTLMSLQMFQPLELLITKAAWGNVGFLSPTRHLKIYLV